MAIVNITVKDINGWYTPDNQTVWVLMDFQPRPQVTMQRFGTEEIQRGTLSDFKNFVRLLPEVKPSGIPKRKYTRKAKVEQSTEARKEQANQVEKPKRAKK